MCHQYFRLLVVVLFLSVTGCGSENQQGALIDEEPYDLAELMVNADPEKGAAAYMLCRACHTLGQGEGHKSGPALYGMFGTTAGTAPGFGFTQAMVDSQVIWTPETMDPWLQAPAAFIPGSRMVFAGVRKAQDRANLIAYLQLETKAPSGSSE